MAPVKRRPHTRSHQMKLRRRRPNISELVYKYLSESVKEGGAEASRNCDGAKCRFCSRPKPREEVLNSLDSRAGRGMANKRKESAKNSKIHRVKRRQTSREQTLSSCMHRTTSREGVRRMKKYIQKAINFGVESGYLIPKDEAYRVLRVSSDLTNDSNYTFRVRKRDSTVSQARDRSPRRTSPIRFEDYEVQDARRRRRRGRRRRRSRRSRSRSGSRRRRRRSRRRGRRRSAKLFQRTTRSRSADGEEVVQIENDDDNYDSDKQDERKKNPENAKRDEGNEQLNQSDGEKTIDKKREDDASDMSMDDEESDEDEDEEKKAEGTTKS
ncbi:uncharacterized protein LOC143430402 [Xylocopa sonorina]|uniref:uncharacterized protein LOC143430402 n=1 Tax=Xylocopa sonorina TaxID=1818115 RepID=UPI00403AD146